MSKRSKARQKFQQDRRDKARNSRVKSEKYPPTPVGGILAQNAPEPQVLLTRKVKGKRTLSATRSKPTGYTSGTKTMGRGGEQSTARVQYPLTHATKPRSLLLDPTRQRRVENADERLKPFILHLREKPYQVKPRTHKNRLLMTIYPHDGPSRVCLDNGEPLENTTRERK